MRAVGGVLGCRPLLVGPSEQVRGFLWKSWVRCVCACGRTFVFTTFAYSQKVVANEAERYMARRCFLACAALLLLLSASPPAHAALPPALARAKAALDGLTTYYFQTERGGAPAPPAVDCPCFSCDGESCPKESCAFCGPRSECAGWGCFTSAAQACDCNDPSPMPPGGNSAASYFFACGQVGGSAAPGVRVSPSQCKCVSDWPSACENCYRWWSAVSLEAMVNYAILAKLPRQSEGYRQTLAAAESIFTQAPYNAAWNATAHPTWVDDFAWYGLAYMRVHEWTGDEVWRQRAADLQDWGWRFGCTVAATRIAVFCTADDRPVFACGQGISESERMAAASAAASSGQELPFELTPSA